MAITYSDSSAVLRQPVRRTSWGAILVGVVIAMVTQLLLAILGLAIGMSIVSPLQDANPVDGVAASAGIYWIVSSIISLFAGGFAAGALINARDRRDHVLHGLTVWGLAMLLLFLTIGSGVGGLIGGTASMISGGASMVGDTLSRMAPQAADAARRGLEQADFDFDLSEWREEVRQLLRDTGVEAIQPEQMEEQAGEVEQEIRAAVNRAGQNPQRIDRELESLLDTIQREGRETLRAVDREALVNLVAERTDQTRQQATETVANWEQGYQEAYQFAREEWDQAKAQAEEKAREWGDQAADGIAHAAWWTFLTLLLGAIAAAIGANLGFKRATAEREHHDVEQNTYPRGAG